MLSWRIEELGDALKSHHHLEDFASVLLPVQVNAPLRVSPQHPLLGGILGQNRLDLGFFGGVFLPQEPVTVLGQIGCDSNGKLNAKSVVLEGDREHSSGGQIPLDLSELKEYSLFPGQVRGFFWGENP